MLVPKRCLMKKRKQDGARIDGAGPALWICLGLVFLLLPGCGTTGGQIQAGRRDLLYGDPNNALSHFQRAAEQDPHYLYYGAFPQGVWTYVGGAYYSTGRLSEARN